MKTEKHMTVVEHLTELRRRIIWVLVVFVLFLVAGLFYAGEIITYVTQNPITHLPSTALSSFSPSDALQVYMLFAFWIALVLTLPVALFHLWRFVSPGLRPHERRVALKFIPIAFILFVTGLLFGYFVVFPMIMQFMLSFASEVGATPLYGLSQFFSFLFNMVIPFGFLFEMPIIVIFLTRLRILNPIRLAKMRRIAYFVLAVIGVVLTPPEIISDITVTIPLLILYEVSVWLSQIVYRRQLKEDEEWERQQNDGELPEST